jgi:imidazolonepropionase-like amidohydrolase
MASVSTLFQNVRVFDGRSEILTGPTSVLVSGSTIAAIGDVIPEPAADEQRSVIDGANRVLMPGLIDAHFHTMFNMVSNAAILTGDITYLGIAAAAGAREALLRGFTSVRDLGGPSFGLKLAIDQGLTPGPRIWPSGAFISQTSGHGDFRMLSELPRGVCGDLSYTERVGGAVIADGVPEVLRGVREQLMRGASQVKVMAGGGVSSSYDPLDVTEYTESEMRAAVEAAEDWGTYVVVHAYTPRAVQRALKVGVKCIDHGHLLDEATAEMIVEHDAWWSVQPFLDDEFSKPHPHPTLRAKQLKMMGGTDTAYELAVKHGVKLAWGTDALFDPDMTRKQGGQLAKMTRWFTPAEVLRMATSTNAELLALSGERNPYPGVLGVVEVGAMADLLLVDGNPLTDLSLVATPDTSFVVIMKDGAIHKNTLPH